jgi:hypothetical protein
LGGCAPSPLARRQPAEVAVADSLVAVGTPEVVGAGAVVAGGMVVEAGGRDGGLRVEPVCWPFPVLISGAIESEIPQVSLACWAMRRADRSAA